MITADQLLAHAIGDYIIQSDWMATNKTKAHIACLIHAIAYGAVFLFFTQSPLAIMAIVSTHFVIDRWHLARFIIWARNWVGIPEASEPSYGGQYPLWDTVNKPWNECKATGFKPDRPVWLATWLLIITDNILHVLINGMAIRWL